MSLADVPLLVILAGMALYVVLGGADFGAAIWQALAGRGERGEQLRDFAHDAMAPVWESNHVWLIFVLVVLWTAYPQAFGAIASTQSPALFLAGIGMIVRGAAYVLRQGALTDRERRRVDALSSISSILTPFALGAMLGGIASGRVPVGNAAGDRWSSWLNPTSAVTGALAIAVSAYVAAIYMSGDAVRLGRPQLAEAFRTRALVAGVIAGAVAIGGLIVLHHDARGLADELLTGRGLPAVIVSVLAGLATLALVAGRRYEAARYTGATAVAAIVAGWALAQEPRLLPGLSVHRAAAPHDVLVAVLVAVGAGAVVLFPSLVLLFRLTLGGTLRAGEPGQIEGGGHPQPATTGPVLAASVPGLLARVAAACLIAGFGLLNVAEAGWAHALGVVALLGFVVCGFVALAAGDPAGEITPR